MTTRSLIRILGILTLGWLFILGPGVVTYWSVLQNAGAYRRAEFVVTGSNCIGGTRDSHGSSSARYCFLTGQVQIDGKLVKEEISVGSTLPADRPPGTRFDVYYDPAQPAFGANYLNQRVLPADESSPGVMGQRWLRAAATMVAWSLGMALLVHVLLRLGVRRLARPPQVALDLDGLMPGEGPAAIGTFFFSQGLAFLLVQIPNPAWGGVVLGLILGGIGTPLLLRRFVVFSKDDGRTTRGLQLLGQPLRAQDEPLPALTKVTVRKQGGRGTIALSGPKLGAPVEGVGSSARCLEVGQRLADLFGVPLEDTTQAEAEENLLAGVVRAGGSALRRLVVPVVLLALVGGIAALTLERAPAVRLAVVTSILEPAGTPRQFGFLRRWALDRLARDPSPEALLQMLRLLNTVDAASGPEIAADVDAAAARRAGLAPTAGEDRGARIRAINQWAAEHLGRKLDANGGVLGWMPLPDRFVRDIDQIAGEDRHWAWVSWAHFAAGDLVTPEQFLYAVGAALGDPRPIHFAIWRSGSSFEGQPDPIDSRPDVLVRTVGEALALQLWLKEGVGDTRFPDDFGRWWAEWARRRRLPPPPVPGRP